MPEDLVSSGCSSSFVLEYKTNPKAWHMSFLFFVLWPILVAFMHFAQETVGHYLQQSLGLSTFSSFSSLPSLPARFQVVLCVFGLWSVVQSFLLILSFDQAKQQHSVASFHTNNPQISLSSRWFLSLVRLVFSFWKLQKNTKPCFLSPLAYHTKPDVCWCCNDFMTM